MHTRICPASFTPLPEAGHFRAVIDIAEPGPATGDDGSTVPLVSLVRNFASLPADMSFDEAGQLVATVQAESLPETGEVRLRYEPGESIVVPSGQSWRCDGRTLTAPAKASLIVTYRWRGEAVLLAG